MVSISASPPTQALDFFAARFGIDAPVCDELLRLALDRGGDYADLFFEYRRQRSLSFEEQAVRGVTSGIVQGLGVRVVLGEAVGYASTERFDRESMRQAARTAANIATAGGGQIHQPETLHAVSVADRYPVDLCSIDEPAATLLDVVRWADGAARAVAPSVQQVRVGFSDQVKQIAVATSEGRLVGETRPLIGLYVIALSIRGSDRQESFDSKALRVGLTDFIAGEHTPEAIGRTAAERAVRMHDAVEAPAGFLPVVLAPGNPGILLHEAVGHGLEADFNRRRMSNFTGRIGQQVASPLCTVVDDGTVARLNGSINVDDEAQAPQNNILIEHGILRGYLHDWISARHYGVPPSGNGRRQDFRSVPMPRMTTTYLLPGDDDPEEIIRSVSHGVYCRSFTGGEVNISNGDYVFSTEEAYLIENGRVTAPIRTTNLIGNGPDSMTRVTRVGGDLQLSDGAGLCGKNWQSLPVSLGLPTILVNGITVGGTKQ